MKVIIFGSNGLVGSSISRILENSAKVDQIIKSNRSELDLFKKDDVEEFIKDYQPNVIINAAAKVGGIYANDTKRTEFILENLRDLLNSILSLFGISKILLSSSIRVFLMILTEFSEYLILCLCTSILLNEGNAL